MSAVPIIGSPGPYPDLPRTELDRNWQRAEAELTATMADNIDASEVAALSTDEQPWPFGGDDLTRIYHDGAPGTLWQREADRERRLDDMLSDLAAMTSTSVDSMRRRWLHLAGVARRHFRADA